jgi:hypothetical protein
MDADSFNTLALRVIAREADADERRALEQELASALGRREEFAQLKVTHAMLATVAPMAEAARETTPELPAYRRNELRTAVRQHFGPAASRRKEVLFGLLSAVRWLFAGSGVAIVGVALVLVCFGNRSVEVGLYGSDLVRSDNTALSQKDVPDAQLVTFDQDAPFDQWQNRPLAWNEHAKIWVDNEHDLLHIVRRIGFGRVITESQPLAQSDEGQREQIKQAVEALKK